MSSTGSEEQGAAASGRPSGRAADGDPAGGSGDGTRGSRSAQADGAARQIAGAVADQVAEGWQNQLNALGGFIRVQRRLADMSLREMAALTSVSNAYLSQIERGLHQPSLRVLRSIAQALGISPEDLLRRANILSDDGNLDGTAADGDGGSGPGPGGLPDTEAAIAADSRLSPSQREALLNVYRSFRDST